MEEEAPSNRCDPKALQEPEDRTTKGLELTGKAQKILHLRIAQASPTRPARRLPAIGVAQTRISLVFWSSSPPHRKAQLRICSTAPFLARLGIEDSSTRHDRTLPPALLPVAGGSGWRYRLSLPCGGPPGDHWLSPEPAFPAWHTFPARSVAQTPKRCPSK